MLFAAASDAAASVADEISSAASQLTGDAKENGEVYVNMVKKAASKVCFLTLHLCSWEHQLENKFVVCAAVSVSSLYVSWLIKQS